MKPAPLTPAEQRALAQSPEAIERMMADPEDTSWRTTEAFTNAVRAAETKTERTARELDEMTTRHQRERATLERTQR